MRIVSTFALECIELIILSYHVRLGLIARACTVYARRLLVCLRKQTHIMIANSNIYLTAAKYKNWKHWYDSTIPNYSIEYSKYMPSLILFMLLLLFEKWCFCFTVWMCVIYLFLILGFLFPYHDEYTVVPLSLWTILIT